jgi:DMSO/TMAO reductase YedYZ heme-binding membrane subunit
MSHAIFHFLRSGVLGNFEGMIFQALQRNWAITLGTIAFICMIPLFFTSTPKSIQKLGQKNWFALHKINHLIFILASLHIGFLTFSEKGNIDPVPLMFLGIYIAGYGYLGYA